MATCRCTNLKQAEHLGRACENLATESDGYCKACHDHVKKDATQDVRDARPATLSVTSVTKDGPRAVHMQQRGSPHVEE